MRSKAVSVLLFLFCFQSIFILVRAQVRSNPIATPVPNVASTIVPAGAVPAPKDIIGFTPGDDRKLASWTQVVDYFNALAKSSDRVVVQEVGKTTLGRPFIYRSEEHTSEL